MGDMRVYGSYLVARKDHERRLLGVATNLADHWNSLDLDEEPSIEQVMSMDLSGVFALFNIELYHREIWGHYRLYGDLPNNHDLFLTTIAPLFRSGSRITGEYDGEVFGQWRFSGGRATFYPPIPVTFSRLGTLLPKPRISNK